LEDWHADEPTYRTAGLKYVKDADFDLNQEHPFLAKYILGATQVCPAPQKRGWYDCPPQRPPSLRAWCCSPSPGGWRATGAGCWPWRCGRSPR
jgi:hypothetical protein